MEVGREFILNVISGRTLFGCKHRSLENQPPQLIFTSVAYKPKKFLIVNVKYLFTCIKRKEEIYVSIFCGSRTRSIREPLGSKNPKLIPGTFFAKIPSDSASKVGN